MSKKFKLAHQVVAGALFAVSLASSAAAQVPDQILRDMFGTLKQLQQNRRIPPSLEPYDQSGPGAPWNISSTKPTIDCLNIKTPLGLILCSDENAARADWDVNAAAWAYEEDSVPRKDFRGRHDAWVQSLFLTFGPEPMRFNLDLPVTLWPRQSFRPNDAPSLAWSDLKYVFWHQGPR